VVAGLILVRLEEPMKKFFREFWQKLTATARLFPATVLSKEERAHALTLKQFANHGLHLIVAGGAAALLAVWFNPWLAATLITLGWVAKEYFETVSKSIRGTRFWRLDSLLDIVFVAAGVFALARFL
jgi:hypothetical protein